MGRFLSATDPPVDPTYELVRAGPGVYKLRNKFRYLDDRGQLRTYTVPKDPEKFETDLASIPFFATWLVPRDGAHTPAALLHDALLKDELEGRIIPADEADRLFRDGMWDLGVPLLRRWMMWAAVSLRTLVFAKTAWRYWFWLVIAVAVVSSTLLSLGTVGYLLDMDQGWRPLLLGDSWVGRNLHWIVLASLPLWLKRMRVGAITTAAAIAFAVPMVLAFAGFILYSVGEYVVQWVLQGASKLPVPSPAGPLNPPRLFRLRPRPAAYNRRP
jgi:hypothetical protein